MSHDAAFLLTKPDPTLDTIFWASVADAYSRGKRIYFKSVGNKDTLGKILDDIIATNCSTVSVCMDSDYDDHLGARRGHPRAAYTMGYSWESDVLLKPVVAQILAHYIGPLSADLKLELAVSLEKLERDLKKWCEIDIALKARSKPCILDRTRPMSYLVVDAFPPKLDHARMGQRLNEIGYKTRPRSVVTVSDENVIHTTCGKVIGKILYNFVLMLVKRSFPRIRIDYDSFMRVALSETFSLVRTGKLPHLATHMEQQSLAFA